MVVVLGCKRGNELKGRCALFFESLSAFCLAGGAHHTALIRQVCRAFKHVEAPIQFIALIWLIKTQRTLVLLQTIFALGRHNLSGPFVWSVTFPPLSPLSTFLSHKVKPIASFTLLVASIEQLDPVTAASLTSWNRKEWVQSGAIWALIRALGLACIFCVSVAHSVNHTSSCSINSVNSEANARDRVIFCLQVSLK